MRGPLEKDKTASAKDTPPSSLSLTPYGKSGTFPRMSTLLEVEAVVATFSSEELSELERFIRKSKQQKAVKAPQSALDLAPLDLGQTLRPLGTREEWYDEMLEGRA